MAKKKFLSDSGQGEQINPKLLQLASNIVFPGDVRTKHNYWLSEVIVHWSDKNNWLTERGWTRDFGFLPHPEDWVEIKNEFKAQLETLKTTPCYVLNWDDNLVSIVMQPLDMITGKPTGIDLLRPDVVIFFKGSKKNTWKENTSMFRVLSSRYIDTKKLTLLVVMKKDNCWSFYGDVLNSPASVKVIASELLRYDPDGVEYPDICYPFCDDLRRVKRLRGIKRGSGRPMVNPGISVDKDEWQPKFKLLYTDIGADSAALNGGKDLAFQTSATPEGTHEETCPAYVSNGQCNGQCSLLPVNILLKKAYRDDVLRSINTINDIHYFLYPHDVKQTPSGFYESFYGSDRGGDFQRDGKGANSDWSNAWQCWLPELFNEQPHLIASEHCSAQFMFMGKLIHTAILNRCRITYETGPGEYDLKHGVGLEVKGKKRGEQYGTAKHVLQYRIKTRASTAGICYHFECGSQIWRTELGVHGFAAGKNAAMIAVKKFQEDMDGAMNGIFGDDNGGFFGFFNWIRKIGIALLPGWIAGVLKNLATDPQGFMKGHGLDKLMPESASNAGTTEQGDDSRDKSGDPSKMEQVLTAFNVIPERVDKTKSKSEQYQTSLKNAVKSEVKGAGFGALGKSCEKAMFFVNTTNIDYSFGEYFNRSMRNPFEIHFDVPTQLSDAIYNNNNVSVAQYLNNRIMCLNNLIQDWGAHEIQADVKLFFDGTIGAEFQNAFAAGTTIYRRKTFMKDFPQLTLVHSNVRSADCSNMTSTDPGTTSGLVENLPGTGDKEGKPSKGEDCTSVERTSCFVYKDSYCTNLDTGQNFFSDMVDEYLKGWHKSPESSTTWYFKEATRPELVITTVKGVKIPRGRYRYQLRGFKGPGEVCPEDEMDTAVFWSTWDATTGCAAIHFKMRGKGAAGGVKIDNTPPTPPVPRGDTTLPDGSTLGGRPNPVGGGGIPDVSVDTNEMGFSMDASLGGMDFGMNEDMTMATDISDVEVNQMTADIFDTQNDDLDDFVDTTNVEENTTVDDQNENTANQNNQDTQEGLDNTLDS